MLRQMTTTRRAKPRGCGEARRTSTAAAWCLAPVYHYDRDDHGCDDLFVSGEALLHWWTSHRPELHHAFTSAG
jgi:hypothetical protein